eukprot:TRINITY_DN42068_c0_g1_i1.p1 TRINITY_DN42068_c0_g1~~TRINITY_DN42068_c0_g1_i1.p1  ORF type:complete len:545 (+),score=63.29 TRINITY_DN42068_c0_g1_i1:16-1650(+)
MLHSEMSTPQQQRAEPLVESQPEQPRNFWRGLLIGFGVGLVSGILALAAVWSATARGNHSEHPSSKSGKVGMIPLVPTMCNTLSSNSAPIAVLVNVDGNPYAMVPDTGSSNFNLASSACGAKCDVSPKWTSGNSDKPGATFQITYGSGGAIMTVATAKLSLAGLELSKGTFGAIVDQYAGPDGFNLFPARTDIACYNSFAGILGLAYRGQDAGPGSRNLTANGTMVPLLDQLVATTGMPNAFAMEICYRYPQPCGPRTDTNTWAPSRSCDRNYSVGNFYLGGYRSSSLLGEMKYTPISDEIHYDVELLGIEVCGLRGCKNVSFPDKIGGTTEDSCVCKTKSCSLPLDPDEYCYFAVVDSGTDGIYMNTVGNTKALLEAMLNVDMVAFPPDQNSASLRRSFYFNQTAVLGAHPVPESSFRLFFPRDDGTIISHRLLEGVIFRQTMAGLVQLAVQGNLGVAAAFQSNKFPVLLGTSFMAGKVVFFDRSRRRIGFADVKPERCGAPLGDEAEIDVRGLAGVDTPGAGCRRGTGSGGGCPQSMKIKPR